MDNSSKRHIFFVDDEPKIRELVGGTLEQAGFKVSCFADAFHCIEKLRSTACDLLITDVKLPEMSGIELLTETKRFFPFLPILVITGYGDVPMAVKAMKAGAADFIEKPLEKHSLISAIEIALEKSPSPDSFLRQRLTNAEIKVLRLILDGKTNKETAYLLHRSVSTVEVHRKHIMSKLDAKNVVDLIKRASEMGLIEPQPPQAKK